MEMSASDKLWNCTVVFLTWKLQFQVDSITMILMIPEILMTILEMLNISALHTYLKASWFFNFLLEKYNLL